MCFRRFGVRGPEKVRGEWDLECQTLNARHLATALTLADRSRRKLRLSTLECGPGAENGANPGCGMNEVRPMSRDSGSFIVSALLARTPKLSAA